VEANADAAVAVPAEDAEDAEPNADAVEDADAK